MLKRLPRPPPCGPTQAPEVTKDILSSLKDHLWQRRGDQVEENEEPEPTGTHLPHHWDEAPQKEWQGTSGEWEITEAREAHWQVLVATSILEERIE